MLPARGWYHQPDPTESSGDGAALEGKFCLESRDSYWVYFHSKHLDCEIGSTDRLSVSPSLVAHCCHLLEEEEGKEVKLLKPDGSCDGGQSLRERCGCGSGSLHRGSGRSINTVQYAHKQLPHFQ